MVTSATGSGSAHVAFPETPTALTCQTTFSRTDVVGPPSAASRIDGSSSAVTRRRHVSSTIACRPGGSGHGTS